MDYHVTECGKVYSMKNNKIKELKPRLNSSGYLCVAFYIDGKAIQHTVHKLVATKFLGKGTGVVDHIDGNRLNNSVENLRWIDQSTNIIKSKKYGRLPIEVVHYLRGNRLNMAERRVLAEQYNMSVQTVSNVINRRSHKD